MSGVAHIRQQPKGDYDGEAPGDTLDRKLAQAEALSKTLYGASDDLQEGFMGWQPEIQEQIHWLLADLIHDCRVAWDRECRAQSLAREKRESA